MGSYLRGSEISHAGMAQPWPVHGLTPSNPWHPNVHPPMHQDASGCTRPWHAPLHPIAPAHKQTNTHTHTHTQSCSACLTLAFTQARLLRSQQRHSKTTSRNVRSLLQSAFMFASMLGNCDRMSSLIQCDLFQMTCRTQCREVVMLATCTIPHAPPLHPMRVGHPTCHYVSIFGAR